MRILILWLSLVLPASVEAKVSLDSKICAAALERIGPEVSDLEPFRAGAARAHADVQRSMQPYLRSKYFDGLWRFLIDRLTVRSAHGHLDQLSRSPRTHAIGHAALRFFKQFIATQYPATAQDPGERTMAVIKGREQILAYLNDVLRIADAPGTKSAAERGQSARVRSAEMVAWAAALTVTGLATYYFGPRFFTIGPALLVTGTMVYRYVAMKQGGLWDRIVRRRNSNAFRTLLALRDRLAGRSAVNAEEFYYASATSEIAAKCDQKAFLRVIHAFRLDSESNQMLLYVLAQVNEAP